MRGLPFWQIFLLGFLLVTIGLVLSWLMALRLMPTNFFLALVAYGSSVIGLMVGLVGSAWHIAQNRKSRGRHE